jgi:hypothetical protein
MITVDLGHTDETDPDKVEALMHDALQSLKIFDFSDLNMHPIDTMDAVSQQVYHRLHRVAVTAPSGPFKADEGKGDASLLPAGKIYTEEQVIEILGPDYASGLVINQKCCN